MNTGLTTTVPSEVVLDHHGWRGIWSHFHTHEHTGRRTTETGKDVIAIVNPVAGRGRAHMLWERAAKELRHLGFDASTLVTTKPGDGTVLARSALAQGHRTIIVVGGDGTVHEVVNAFLDGDAVRDDARLAVLPAGTGMDFARNIGARRGISSAVERLVRGNERRIDVGLRADGAQIFVNFAETGLGAAVVTRQRELAEAWPGRVSFFLAAMRAAVEERNSRVMLTIDGTLVHEGPVVSVVVANGRYFGGGMKVAPHADMHDGQFDVFVLGNFGRFELISQVWKIYPGMHVGHSKVRWWRGRRVDIESERTTHLDLDGELGGRGPYHFRVLPQALRVVV